MSLPLFEDDNNSVSEPPLKKRKIDYFSLGEPSIGKVEKKDA